MPTYGQLFSQSWEILKKNLALYVGLSICLFAMNSFLSAISFIGIIASMLLSGPITSSMIYSMKKLRDSGQLNWSDLFWGFADLNRFLNLVVASFFVSLFVCAATLFFILPGIYLYVSYLFVYQLMIYQNLNPWDALVRSYHLVNKNWWYYFGLLCIVGLLNLVGMMSFLIGLIVTVPTSMLMVILSFEDAIKNEQLDSGLVQETIQEQQLSFSDELK